MSDALTKLLETAADYRDAIEAEYPNTQYVAKMKAEYDAAEARVRAVVDAARNTVEASFDPDDATVFVAVDKLAAALAAFDGTEEDA